MSILQKGVGACSAAPVASINTLGFAKPPSQTRVVAAMSGGVDSSVVAVMLKRQGYEVIGITLQLYDHGAATSKVGACCAGQDIHDARRVADAARIPHYVLDYESRFREAVMEDFADTYLSGATPIPCVRCNQTVKFADLKRVAEQLGADCLATGHYVRRVERPAGAELHRAADPGRDQSYFLFATTREQLEFLRFPLGDMPKPAVRALAAEYGVRVAEKPDSQDICFVPQGKYQDVVKKLRPGAAAPGEIVDTDGHVLGQHDGIVNYTVGQRRGLGVATGQPLFVVKLDAGKRRVIVGPRAALGVTRIALKEVNWIGDAAADPEALDGLPLCVRVRSTRPPVSARLSVCNQAWAVQLDAPEEGVAPGQAAVFYDMNSTRVLGGGWIAATDSQSSN